MCRLNCSIWRISCKSSKFKWVIFSTASPLRLYTLIQYYILSLVEITTKEDKAQLYTFIVVDYVQERFMFQRKFGKATTHISHHGWNTNIQYLTELNWALTLVIELNNWFALNQTLRFSICCINFIKYLVLETILQKLFCFVRKSERGVWLFIFRIKIRLPC